jgi:hypothetical protein
MKEENAIDLPGSRPTIARASPYHRHIPDDRSYPAGDAFGRPHPSGGQSPWRQRISDALKDVTKPLLRVEYGCELPISGDAIRSKARSDRLPPGGQVGSLCLDPRLHGLIETPDRRGTGDSFAT